MAPPFSRAVFAATFFLFIIGSSAWGRESWNATDSLRAPDVDYSGVPVAFTTPISNIPSPVERANGTAGGTLFITPGSQGNFSRPSDASLKPTSNPSIDGDVAETPGPEFPHHGFPPPEYRPRIEVSETGWMGDIGTPETPYGPSKPTPTGPSTVTIGDNVFTPVPIPGIQIGETTLIPGGKTATIGDKPDQTLIHLDPSGHPVVVIGSSTSTYQPSITSGQVPATPVIPPLTVGDVTATVVTDYQYVVSGLTLGGEEPVTVGGQIISLSKDSAGATVLVAGGTTSALSHGGLLNGLPISAAVVSDTTHYVVGSQTLAPGTTITLNGTRVSLTTSSGSILGVVGGTTTTIHGPTITPPVAPPGDFQGVSAVRPTSTKSGCTSAAQFRILTLLGIWAALIMR